MSTFRVHLRQKRHGELVLTATDQADAIAKAKRLIHTDSLPATAMSEESRIIVAFSEQV